MSVEVNQSEVSLSYTYAPISTRIIAYIIDRVILFTGAFVVLGVFTAGILIYLVATKGLNSEQVVQNNQSLQIILSVIAFIAEWLYYSLFESSSHRATPGKRAMGIVVTNLEGNKISFAQATIRFFAKILCYLTLLIGFFIAVGHPQRQALHDRIAKTIVIIPPGIDSENK